MREKKKFRVKEYCLNLDKVPEGKKIRLALIADLHGVDYKDRYARLLGTLREKQPDAVLLAGDMICRGRLEAALKAETFLCRLAEEFPVFYGMGNHETSEREKQMPWFLDYENHLIRSGIVCLHNEASVFCVKELPLQIYGLEIPHRFYKKPFPPCFRMNDLTARLGSPDPDKINILIAHHPLFADTYLSWEADLTVCGHYHGGVWRFSEHAGAISPLLHPFPRYCCGDYRRGNQYLVVSPGMGEHTMPLRVHNPRELIFINLVPKEG